MTSPLCSQILYTDQPRRRSLDRFIRSFLIPYEIFFTQNRTFDFGILKCLGQLCQKQPSVKTAILSPKCAKSGFPGRSLAWNLKPFPKKNSLKRLSSPVSLPFIFDIISDLFFRLNMSIGAKFYLDTEGV